MPTIERQVVLECVQPSKNHNKFYEITIMERTVHELKKTGQTRYQVDCRWGRIENFANGNPQQQTKLDTGHFDDAMTEVGTIMSAKLKKGYKIVKDSATNTGKHVKFTSKSQEKRVKLQTNQPAPFERTEHVEVIVSDWWKSGHDNIEERAV